FEDWRTASKSFRGLAAYAPAPVVFDDEGRPADRVSSSYVSTNLFDVIGEAPLLGRVFTPTDDQHAAAPVIVLGEGARRERYGSDPHIVGQSIRVNNEPVTVIGVIPARFRFPMIDKAWLPLGMAPQTRDRRRDARILAVVGRLADGVTISEARAELD